MLLSFLLACIENNVKRRDPVEDIPAELPADVSAALSACFSSDAFEEAPSSLANLTDTPTLAVSNSFKTILAKYGYTWEEFANGEVTADLVVYAKQPSPFGETDDKATYGVLLVLNSDTTTLQERIESNSDEFNNIDINFEALQELAKTESLDAGYCRAEVAGLAGDGVITSYKTNIIVYDAGETQEEITAQLEIKAGRDNIDITVNGESDSSVRQDSDEAEQVEASFGTLTKNVAYSSLYFAGEDLDSSDVDWLAVVHLTAAP